MGLTLFLVISLLGCVSDKPHEDSYPINPDPTKLEAVEPGKSDRTEILDWFGSPQLTYDGDVLALRGGPEELRKAVPEGTVALGYFIYQMEFNPSTEITSNGMAHAYEEKVVSKERVLFIISKEDGVVKAVDRAVVSNLE